MNFSFAYFVKRIREKTNAETSFFCAYLNLRSVISVEFWKASLKKRLVIRPYFKHVDVTSIHSPLSTNLLDLRSFLF